MVSLFFLPMPQWAVSVAVAGWAGAREVTESAFGPIFHPFCIPGCYLAASLGIRGGRRDGGDWKKLGYEPKI